MDTNLINNSFNTLYNTWNNFGEKEPYWSVITNPQFQGKGITNEIKSEFYSTGLVDINYIIYSFKNILNIDFQTFAKSKKCLEFGCGCGRTTIHLAKYFYIVLGLDISVGHLNLLDNFIKKFKINNIITFKSGLDITQYKNMDFIYTSIVLQHNEPPLIRSFIKQLLNNLNINGIAFIHLPVEINGYKYDQNKSIDQVNIMQMHCLSIKEVVEIIKNNNCELVKFDDSINCCGPNYYDGIFIIKKN